MLQAAALGALTVGASLTVALQHQLEKRAFVTADEAVSKSYDYIVVGYVSLPSSCPGLTSQALPIPLALPQQRRERRSRCSWPFV